MSWLYIQCLMENLTWKDARVKLLSKCIYSTVKGEFLSKFMSEVGSIIYTADQSTFLHSRCAKLPLGQSLMSLSAPSPGEVTKVICRRDWAAPCTTAHLATVWKWGVQSLNRFEDVTVDLSPDFKHAHSTAAKLGWTKLLNTVVFLCSQEYHENILLPGS